MAIHMNEFVWLWKCVNEPHFSITYENYFHHMKAFQHSHQSEKKIKKHTKKRNMDWYLVVTRLNCLLLCGICLFTHAFNPVNGTKYVDIVGLRTFQTQNLYGLSLWAIYWINFSINSYNIWLSMNSDWLNGNGCYLKRIEMNKETNVGIREY